jgi:hypothetical protein
MLGPVPFIDDKLTIRSDKTSLEATFVIKKVERCEEGDILCWSMFPTKRSIYKHSKLKGVELVVFNT